MHAIAAAVGLAVTAASLPLLPFSLALAEYSTAHVAQATGDRDGRLEADLAGEGEGGADVVDDAGRDAAGAQPLGPLGGGLRSRQRMQLSLRL